MKNFLAAFALVCLLGMSSVAYAQENTVFVLLTSNPKDVPIYVDDTITFTRKVVSVGMDTFTYKWNWNNEVLDCDESTEPDDTDLICTAIAVGTSDVSYSVVATMDDQSEMTAESEIITVEVSDELPEVADYIGHQNETAIRYLYDNGIVEGYPDGTFKPDNNLTRAELMKILVLGAGYDPDAEIYNGCFPDVGNDWFARYVCFAYENGWVEGYEDGEFKPGENVLKVEAIKMLLEIFEVELRPFTVSPYEDVSVEEWYAPYIITAQDMVLLEEEGLNYYPGDEITRGQVSENIYRLLTFDELI